LLFVGTTPYVKLVVAAKKIFPEIIAIMMPICPFVVAA